MRTAPMRRHKVEILLEDESALARALLVSNEVCASEAAWLRRHLEHVDWADADWKRLREIVADVGLNIAAQDDDDDDGAGDLGGDGA